MTKLSVAVVLMFLAVTVTLGSSHQLPATPPSNVFAIDAPMREEDEGREYSGKIPPGGHTRTRRAATCGIQTKLHPVQVEEAVLSHNHYRSKEKAANMHSLVHSDEMAAVAQAWADQCKWEHGMLYDCSGDRVGQNLFIEASSGGYPATNMTKVAEAWAGERKDWNFATGQCNAGKVCGHWSQLAAARSREMGCASAQCPTITVGGQLWKFALLIVCDYYLPGNQQGEPVYLQGTPCSNCDVDQTGAGYRCNNGLCERCYPNTDSTCKCGTPLLCEHGGTWSTATCSCVCAKGFYGDGCEHTCTCEDLTPTECAYWIDYCPVDDYSQYMGENCKKTCAFPCSLPASCN